jgi:hypothetical protein
MADQIDRWKQEQFTRNIELLPQYKGKLAALMSSATYKGKGGEVVKQLGQTEAEDSTGRNSDTPIMTTPRDMRWVYPVKSHWGDLLDEEDMLEQLVDPTSALTQNAAIAMGRRVDKGRIIPAFFGKAKTGPNGGTDTVFINDGTQDVDIKIGSADGNTDTGMNTAKLETLWADFLRNEIDLDVEQINLAVTSKQAAELLHDTRYVNKDYRDTAVIEKGKLMGYMGINIVHVEALPKNGTTRYCPAWVKSGMHLGRWMDMKVRAQERADKSFSLQLYLSQSNGATRVDEKKVFRVNCKET